MCTMCQPRKKNRFLVGIQLCTLTKKKHGFGSWNRCVRCASPEKKQVPGWNPIVYLNEKNINLEVGSDVYDVPAQKNNRLLVGIQLCTLTKNTWIWKLESMCTMCQPRKTQVPGWNPIVYLNEKNMDLEVGIDVYDVPAPKKKTGSWLRSNCVP